MGYEYSQLGFDERVLIGHLHADGLSNRKNCGSIGAFGFDGWSGAFTWRNAGKAMIRRRRTCVQSSAGGLLPPQNGAPAGPARLCLATPCDGTVA